MKLSSLKQKSLINIQLGVVREDMIDFWRPSY